MNYGLAYGLSRLRPVPAARHHPGEAQRADGGVLRAVRRGPRLPARGRRPGPRRPATPRRCSAAAATCPTSPATTGSAARWPSGWRSTPRSRARPPTSSRWRCCASTRRCARPGLRSRMLLQVHDELVFEVAPGEREAVEALVREEMGAATSCDVPLEVSVGVGLLAGRRPLTRRRPPTRRRTGDPATGCRRPHSPTAGHGVEAAARAPSASGQGRRWSGLEGHEDRRAGEERGRAAGSSRPTPGCWPPATPARPGRPARSPAAIELADPVAEGAVVLDVQRRAPSASSSTYGVRSKYEPRTVSPPSPGSSGSAQRNGWVVEKTHRPPGRRTRAHLAHQRRRVGDERHRAVRGADHVEAGVGERQGGRVALGQRRRQPGRVP